MAAPIQIGNGLLVLFDGQCGLCNRTARWFSRRDRYDRLRFVPFESTKAKELMARNGATAPCAEMGAETIVAVRDAGGPAERVLLRSEAVLSLLRELPQPWPVIGTALGWIPRPVLDLAYRLVARWRYRIWGPVKVCEMPARE